jgi:hypothetical protein
MENHTQEEGSSPLGLAKAGHEQTTERNQSRTSLSGWSTGGRRATGDGATAIGQAMPLLFGDVGLDLRQFPNLVP